MNRKKPSGTRLVAASDDFVSCPHCGGILVVIQEDEIADADKTPAPGRYSIHRDKHPTAQDLTIPLGRRKK